MSTVEVCMDFRWLCLRCSLAGGGSASCAPDTLPVEVLLILLVSNALLDLRLSKNDSSPGESYSFGIAGTGGTSSSSSPFAVF